MQEHLHKLTIYFGDVQNYLSEMAKAQDVSARLMDSSNYQNILDDLSVRDCVVYSSLGDLPKDLQTVQDILTQADVIHYCPPPSGQWSDGKNYDPTDPGSSLQGLTETLLLLLPSSVEIVDFSPTTLASFDPNPLVDHRKTDDRQLWIVGDSITNGCGLTDRNQRYGQLLADELQLPCTFLAMGGSSIDWAADQILRSDIRANDIVVWGITSPERLTVIHDNQLFVVNSALFQQDPKFKKLIRPSDFTSQQTIYRHFYSIQQVINFCRKIKAKLFLFNVLHGAFSMLGFLRQQKNYITMPNKFDLDHTGIHFSVESFFEDIGTDGLHPGPQQHQTYKNVLLQHINHC